TGSGPGASATTMWQLVPLNPKELTPEADGPAGHGSAAAGIRIGPPSRTASGSGRRRCRVGGIVPCRSARTAFITPATPAAASMCPVLVLDDPTGTARPAPAQTSARAAVSLR